MRKLAPLTIACLALLLVAALNVCSREKKVQVWWDQVKIWQGDENWYEAYQQYKYFDQWGTEQIDQTPTFGDIPHNQWYGVGNLREFITSQASGKTTVRLCLWEQDWLEDDLLISWTEIANTDNMNENQWYDYDKYGTYAETKGSVRWVWVP